MDNLINTFKTYEISRKNKAKMKKLLNSDSVIIDDLMFMALNRQEAHQFFQLINYFYEQILLIITSNKGPEKWGELIGEPAITVAILDQLHPQKRSNPS